MKTNILSTIAVMALSLTLLASCAKAEKPLSAAELLDLGEKYLLELDYEQAILQFTKLIEFEPKNARAYTGLAEAYVGRSHNDKAIEVLRQGLEQLPDHDEIKQMLDDLLPEPVSEQEESQAPEPTVDADTDLSQYLYSNLSYTFDWNKKFWADAIGGCTIDFDLPEYNENIIGVTLISWGEEIGTEHFDLLNSRMSQLKETRKVSYSYSGSSPDFDGHYHSVDPDMQYNGYMDHSGFQLQSDMLGTTVNVLFAVVDRNFDAVGYLIIPVSIPLTTG